MRAEGGVAGVPAVPGQTSRRGILLGAFGMAVVWLVGSAVIILAQHGSDRRISTLAAAGVGIATILALTWLSSDHERGYLRSIVGATVAVSLVSNWLLWHFGVTASGFQVDGLVKRITLPLLVVLFAPLVTHALWVRRAALRRRPRGMDWIVAAYASVVLIPALAIGLYHHNRMLYVAQDLGLIVFFVFMYVVGRVVTADAARASAAEIAETLLALAVAKLVLFGWDISPLYSYYEAAAAAALAVVLLRPRRARLLTVAVAITLLAYDAVQVKHGTNSSTAIELAGALAVLIYVAVRARRLVPQWLVVALAIVAVVGFVGYTHDGAALRGQYHGPDASDAGTTFEAQQARTTVGHSPLAVAVGRGLGGTVDESHAPYWFKITLLAGGRDPTHVQEIHLLGYAILLKAGFLGLAWLAAFLAGLAILVFRSLERAARDREPAIVLYAALPLLGVVQAFAASSRLQADPLNGLALGALVACSSAQRVYVRQVRAEWRPLLAAALCTLAGCVAVVYIGPHVRSSPASSPSQSVSSPEPVAAWIGDAYTAGAGATGATGEGIATSVALSWETDMDAEVDTGFVNNGHAADPHNKPIPDRLRHDAAAFSPPPPSVVVLDAGRSDRAFPPREVHRAVLRSFRLLAKGFPVSAIVVIAPFRMTSKPTDYLALRRLLKQQARRRGWAFVDPIAEGWIDRASARLVRRNGVYPNPRGYRYIVAHLAPAIEKALGAAHEPVRLHCARATPCRRHAPRAR